MAPEVPHLRPVGDGPDPARPSGLTPPARRAATRRFVTDVLVELGFVTAERVAQAEQAARVAQRAPEQLLLDEGAITADQLSRAVAERLGLDHLDLNAYPVDPAAANLLPAPIARRYGVVPVTHLDERTLLVAMTDPSNVVAIDDIAIATGLQIRPAVASADDVKAVIARLTRLDTAVTEAVEEDASDTTEVVDLREAAIETPVIKLVNSVLGQAVERGASDIHFEPEADGMRVRFRVDGVLGTFTDVPRRMMAGVVSRVKIMADLDISERRVPQDGRIAVKVEGSDIDVRVVTLPSVHGESVVMRILDKSGAVLDLGQVGIVGTERERFERAIGLSHGCVLVTGPTGSGKSTTLYGALNKLNTADRNIVTIEDPVEYQLAGLSQVQVNPKAGLSFANGLRSMMRADPDVIMVGEIRDRETAQIAVEAALTGHLVLSTLHTNDAPTALTRLVEMGIEPFLLASAVECVVAQRLARVLCPACKQRDVVEADVLREYGFQAAYDLEAYRPVGCVRCNASGYKGRVGLFEVMPMSAEIRALTLRRASADDIAGVALAEGMRSLRDDGFEKVRQGVTSVEEIVRVTGRA